MDIVVTVPKQLWLMWINEGNLPGQPWNGLLNHFMIPQGRLPLNLHSGDRLYIVAYGKLRGFSPIVDWEQQCTLNPFRSCLIRKNDAKAVTIPENIKGFQGWRYRFWNREDEIEFKDWMDI